jgi:GNAT superfamily N-acetyltransferase
VLEHPGYNPDGHFIALDEGRIVGCGLAMYSKEHADVKGPVGYFDLFLLPGYWGADVERALFWKIVENLRGRNAERISTRVDTRYEERVSHLERLGFSRSEYQNHGMEKDPTGLEEPEVPDGYRIRVAEIPEEIEALWMTFNRAFATRDKYAPKALKPFSKSWVFREDTDKSGIFLATRDSSDEVVAMVVSAINERYNEEHSVRRGGTYSLAVIPSDRKKGLGTCLTLKSIKWIGDKGMDVAYVSVNLANKDAFNIYRLLGYKTVQVYQGYQKSII